MSWAPGALPCEGTGAHRQRREAYPQSSVFIHSFGRPRPSSRGDGSLRKKGDLTTSQRPFDVLQTPGTGVQTLIRFPAQIVLRVGRTRAGSLKPAGDRQPEAQRAGTPLGVSHCRREQWTTDFVLCGDGSSCHSWAGCYDGEMPAGALFVSPMPASIKQSGMHRLHARGAGRYGRAP